MASDLAGLDEDARQTMAEQAADERTKRLQLPSALAVEQNAAAALGCQEWQTFEQSPLAFANDRRSTAAAPLQRETPLQREAVLLRMAGLTVTEIARELGASVAHISQSLRTPWARKRLIEHLHRSKQVLIDTLQQEAAASVLTLVELRDDTEAPKAVRRQAADSLLDRYLGKAPQTVNLNRTELPASVEDAERKLAALQVEAKRLRGN